MAELLVAARWCGQCLTTRNRIVSGERAAQLVADCLRDDIHFQCHKGTITGLNIHCRGVHEIMEGDRAYRMAVALGIPIREIDCDELDAEEGR